MTRLLATMMLFTVATTAHAADAPLADAAERGDWKLVARLLEDDPDLDAAQADGTTALHWATWHDRTAVVVKMIDRGADVKAKNRYGVTALSIACTNGNGKIAERLLQAGAGADTTLPSGETALMTAARTGRVEPVRALLDYGAKVDATERNGQTAIMWAAAEGHVEVVQQLIDAGADFRTPLKTGFTPFFFAVRQGHTNVVDLLLKQGVDVTAIMQAERHGGRLPREGMSALLLAIENGHFELAAHLLDEGADPDDERSGFTPLHAISWVRKPNRGDGLDGNPPPTGSGKMTSLEFVRKLVESGADVNARLKSGSSGRGRLNHKGATPFLFAADTSDVPLMELLLELGADSTITNADGCPPLLAAAGIGTLAPGEEAGTEDEALAAVRLLLKRGADVNAVDKNGETAMHGAAYKSLPKMVQLLADEGADIELWHRKNKYGWTPWLIAEGHRPGNFKPSAETMQALAKVLRTHGIEPPKPTPRTKRNRYD